MMRVTRTDEANEALRIRGDLLEKSAATKGDFILLGSLLVGSQVDDLAAVEIAGVLVRLAATASVEYAYKGRQTDYDD